MNGQQRKPTLAQRQAQSARDKALARRNAGSARKRQGPPRASSAIQHEVPVASSITRRMNRPYVQSRGSAGDIRVVHREYVGDIGGAVAFEARQHAINPGLGWEFPWLSKIAQRYESYRFNKLRYCFETQAPTSSTGTVLGVIDYDATDPAPTDKIQAMNYRDAVRSAPWSSFCLEATKEDLHKRQTYFVRSGATSEDLRLFDTGNFFLCVQGQASTALVGELYVEYDISLMTPQVGDLGWDHAVWGEFTGTSNAAPFATVGGNLPVVVSSTGTTPNSVTTWTFTGPWEGFVSIIVGGTTLTTLTRGGTATNVNRGDVVNSTGVSICGLTELKALTGDTFTMTIANATIASARAMFGQADPL